LNQTKIEFRKVRDFGQLLGVTFDYIKQNFKVLFKSSLLIGAPFILLAGVFMGLYQSLIFNFKLQPELERFAIPFLFAMFFMMLSYLVITVVTYSHLILYKESEPANIEIDDVWQIVKRNFWMILFTGIGYTVLVFIGFVFLIIPGIYLSIALSLIFIIRLEEKLYFFDAVRRCTKIISGNWWFTFGLIIVVGMIQGFLGFILYVPNYIVTIFLAFAGVDSSTGDTGRVLYIISSIIASLGVLLYSISTIAIAFQYYNLVERKEAPGLMEQIEEIK
jgi:hypothetical protein